MALLATGSSLSDRTELVDLNAGVPGGGEDFWVHAFEHHAVVYCNGIRTVLYHACACTTWPLSSGEKSSVTDLLLTITLSGLGLVYELEGGTPYHLLRCQFFRSCRNSKRYLVVTTTRSIADGS